MITTQWFFLSITQNVTTFAVKLRERVAKPAISLSIRMGKLKRLNAVIA